MTLGILTVFLAGPDDGPLLDLYFRQIETCTPEPFTVYAAANRLAPGLVEKLRGRPYVRICPCATTELRQKEEHSYYLECLVDVAVREGATHLVTLHPDSFPIRRGWSGELARRITPSCALVTVERIGTACLMFHRDFVLRYSPRFLLTEADRASAAYEAFRAQWNPIDHSGAGYGFKAFTEGLSMSYLRAANTNRHATFALVYEDLMFHLVGAAGIGRVGSAGAEGREAGPGAPTPLLTQARRLHAALGPASRRLAQGLFPARLRQALGRKVYSEATAKGLYEEARSELLRDPEAYWATLTASR